MSQKTKSDWHIYYQPGQVIFHLTGDQRTDSTALIAWAEKLANEDSKLRDKKMRVTATQVMDFNPPRSSESPPRPQSVRTVDSSPIIAGQQTTLPFLARISGIFKKAPRAKNPPPFSLVFANVESETWPKFLVDAKAEEIKGQMNAFNDLFDLIILLHKNRKSAPVKLEVVSPNWLVSSEPPSEPGGTGGPGGKPFPAQASDIGTRSFNLTSVFPSLMPTLKPEEVAGAAVAILDTSYSIEKLEEIKTSWPKHELIKKLLGPQGALRGADGQLHVYPDPIAENYLPGVKIDQHYDYDMTNHGLFVAGIINSVAPQAELHLYQVLNKYGLGDLRSIAGALQDVMMKFSGSLDKLVINMSLTMNMPLEASHCDKDDQMGLRILSERPKPAWFWNLIQWICRILQWLFPALVLNCRQSWFDRQAMPFEWISDLVSVLGPSIVAAAGNNGAGGYRPSALYPAAFDSVLGVGALSRGEPWSATAPLAPASYSNLADTPTTQGITAFGGEKGRGNGILGVYVGNIPDGTPNGTGVPNPIGWAWWSGTSFATPIISGLAATLVINGNAASTQDALRMILKMGSGVTSAYETIIPVEQQ